MTVFHSTLGAAYLNDEEAHKRKKKWQPARFACSLEVKRLKTGVLQLKDLKIERGVTFFESLKKHFFEIYIKFAGGFFVVVQSIFT